MRSSDIKLLMIMVIWSSKMSKLITQTLAQTLGIGHRNSAKRFLAKQMEDILYLTNSA